MIPVQGAEQIPIPCGRCGGPMMEHGPAALVGPVHVSCPFCHATEALPEQHAQRVMALRARLAHLRVAQAAEEGPALAFARTIQTLRSQVWMYAGIGALVIGVSLNGAIAQIRSAIALTSIPASARAEILASATFPALTIGVFLGAAAGYVLALVKYKKAIEPTLRARAPMQPGLPARCRSCGASLPMGPTTSALVPCVHCAANNLITAELARDRARLLDEEARSYNERARGVLTRTNKASVAFQTYFYIGVGIGLALALVLSVSMRIVIAALFF
jgi:hypothetical protein